MAVVVAYYDDSFPKYYSKDDVVETTLVFPVRQQFSDDVLL